MNMQQLKELQEMWRLLFPGKAVPSNQQFTYWLIRHGYETTREAIANLAERFLLLDGDMTDIHMIKFTSAVAKRRSKSAALSSTSTNQIKGEYARTN